MPYPKFNNLDVIWDLPEDCEEWNHVETTLARLESHLVSLRFVDRFVLFITSQAEKLEIAIDTPVVVYQIKDKVHEVPSYVNDVFLVFKNYVPFYPPSDKVRSVPLGCNKHITSLDVQLIVDRNIDLFFMGSEDIGRIFLLLLEKDLYQARKPKI